MTAGADRLAEVRQRIAAAARAAGRDPAAVTLVAVSKTHGADRVRELLEAGQRVFGENRVQEAEEKFPGAEGRVSRPRAAPDRAAADQQGARGGGPVRRHRVGRPRAAGRHAGQGDGAGRAGGPTASSRSIPARSRRRRACCRASVDAFVAACRDTHKLPVVGLMCIPPVDEEPALHFALLAKMAARNGLAQGQHGHERRLRDGRPAGRHPCPRRQRLVRRPPIDMPELPEVETVRRGLIPRLVGRRIVRLVQRRRDLRVPLPAKFAQRVEGRTVLGDRPAGQIPADPAR